MFSYCRLLRLDISSFNTEQVTNMTHMFYMDNFLQTIDISNFKTNNVIDFSFMFCGCDNLYGLDGTKFNVEKAKYLNLSDYSGENGKLYNMLFSN